MTDGVRAVRRALVRYRVSLALMTVMGLDLAALAGHTWPVTWVGRLPFLAFSLLVIWAWVWVANGVSMPTVRAELRREREAHARRRASRRA